MLGSNITFNFYYYHFFFILWRLWYFIILKRKSAPFSHYPLQAVEEVVTIDDNVDAVEGALNDSFDQLDAKPAFRSVATSN